MRFWRAIPLMAGAALLAACDNDLAGPSNAAPSAAFSAECHRLECTFSNRSTDSDGTIGTYRWDFGDNTLNMTTREAAHIYNAPGQFTVTLTVTDDDGKSAVATWQVTIGDWPTAAFSAGCGTLSCTFKDESSSTGSVLVAWLWDFGDGQTSRAPDPNHLYWVTEPTEFTVTLTVTDDNGTTATVTQKVSLPGRPLADPPTAAFSVTCDALVCTFTDQSTSPGDVLSIWSWDFGDGHTSDGHNPNPVHVYDAAVQTRFTVTLRVCDSNISCGFASQEILVTPDE